MPSIKSMNRVAVFVDAGYVFAQGSVLLAGKKLPRSEVVLEHEAAVQAFGEFASKISSVPLLRIYWYDGTSTGPTAQHLTLAHLPDIKLRLGFVNSVGEQKGVDSFRSAGISCGQGRRNAGEGGDWGVGRSIRRDTPASAGCRPAAAGRWTISHPSRSRTGREEADPSTVH